MTFYSANILNDKSPPINVSQTPSLLRKDLGQSDNTGLPPRIRHWRIDKRLGKGATATVYLGKSLIDNRAVAIKQFSNDLFQNNQHAAAYRKMMMNEAHLVGKLIHPNILQTYSVGMEAEQKYLVMEYVAMGDLEDYINTPNTLGLTEILRIFFQCACGLQYSDEIGVIHRDIKPANVLLQTGGVPKIADFGSSMRKGDTINAISGVGSPAYMSPEQIGERPLNQQTDIYSLAVSLFEIIAGKKPFSANNQYETIFKILHEDPPLLSSLVQSGLPPDLDALLLRAMAKSQDKRYLEWADFIVDLARLLIKIYPAQKKYQTIGEIEAFDWLRACGSLKMFQDNELWDLINIGSVFTIACGLPLNMKLPIPARRDYTDDIHSPPPQPKVKNHAFVLDGALQHYSENQRISVLRTGDYCVDFSLNLSLGGNATNIEAYAIANSTMLVMDDDKLAKLHPVVRDKLSKLIEISAETQRRIQIQRHREDSTAFNEKGIVEVPDIIRSAAL